jgi:hypothetical protein
MRFDRRLVGFGLFLITVGLVMVAVREGWLPTDTARRSWELWPLILIGVGLSILLRGGPGAAIGGLVLALTFGAMVGGVVATGAFVPFGVCSGERSHGVAFPAASGDLSTAAAVTIEQDCGDMTVATAPGATWHVAGVSGDARGPRVEAGSGDLRVNNRTDTAFAFGGAEAWDVVLPEDPTLDLTVRVNAGQSQIDLGGAHLGRVSVERNAGSLDLDLRHVAALGSFAVDVNAGSATLRLPGSSVAGDLTVNAGSAAICRTTGAGLRIVMDGVAASNDFAAHGLVDSGGAWQTDGYASAAVRIEIRAKVNAGSLSLDPSGPCAG